MEPVDPRLRRLLDSGAGPAGPAGSAGGPDELRSIVAKAARRRWRFAALASAVVLAAGAGVGYAASGTGSSPQLVATGSSPTTVRSPAAVAPGGQFAGGAASIAVPYSAHFTHLFTRSVGGIQVRGYSLGSPAVDLPSGMPACVGYGPGFQAEVSTDRMVGLASGSFYTSPSVASPWPTILGQAEGDPTAVVVVKAESNVAKVTMAFTGGATDEMAPVQGWAALASPAGWFTGPSTTGAPVTIGTLTARDSSGKVLSTDTVKWPSVMAMPPVPYVGAAGGGVSSGGVSTGSAPPASGETSPAYACKTMPPSGGCLPPSTATNGAASSASSNCVTPATPPACPPPTTVQGSEYSCAVPAPIQTCAVSPTGATCSGSGSGSGTGSGSVPPASRSGTGTGTPNGSAR